MNDSRAKRWPRGSRLLLLGALTSAVVAGPAYGAASAAGIDDDGVGVHVEITPRPTETAAPGVPGGSGAGSGGSGSGGSGGSDSERLSSTGFDAIGLLAATGIGMGVAGGILTVVGGRAGGRRRRRMRGAS